jgi:hypothetical protein
VKFVNINRNHQLVCVEDIRDVMAIETQVNLEDLSRFVGKISPRWYWSKPVKNS